ncbi:hypothetical protein SMSP2_02975 [Limihaloglobus sulfuriphilus]|uniref:Ice-binding protein C-terminal domain-containing protein n=1 Tax=Limihaloglobus sulfuriphilus TaxID=1851148 RepID=A0A1Q2MIP4_9BACT|nr:PEP-CTERM sorting domain-containing protein [Limihaloglobus sulfuriphilus]AQQ72585.1 hypothetical protein SMSP2_02975 [Limihaloglobus sulfuriphilus]
MSTKTNLMVLMLAIASIATAAVTVAPTINNGDFEAQDPMTGWRYYDTNNKESSDFNWVTGYGGSGTAANYIQLEERQPRDGGGLHDYGFDRYFGVITGVSQGDVVQLKFNAMRNDPNDTTSRLSVKIAEVIDHDSNGTVSNPDGPAFNHQGALEDNQFNVEYNVWGEYTTTEFTVQDATTDGLSILFKYCIEDTPTAIPGNYSIDNVQFVPEPATLMIMGLGVFGMIKRRKA